MRSSSKLPALGSLLAVPAALVLALLAKVAVEAVPAPAWPQVAASVGEGIGAGVDAIVRAFNPTPVATAKDLGIPFDRYTVKDEFGRDIEFYVSIPPQPKDGQPAKDLPIALFIQGSGATSLFQKAPGGRIGGGLQNLLLNEAKGRFRVMCVEKPGVAFLDTQAQPGSAEGSSEVFRREHTVERWTAALRASLLAARTLPGIDASRVLVAGHSEGADMAAHLARACPDVGYVGVLSGGGPTQLFDLAVLASKGQFGSTHTQHAVEEIYSTWAKIEKDPDRIDLMAWGHPYRRWSSFIRTSPLESLRASNARVYLAYGTKDQAVPPESAELVRATLVAGGRDVEVDRREGEDHGFSKPGQDPSAGFAQVFTGLIRWWLGDSAG